MPPHASRVQDIDLEDMKTDTIRASMNRESSDSKSE